MDLELTGKAYLVTGGSSGLGLAIARRLLREGALVSILGRDAERLQAAAKGLEHAETVLPLQGDVTHTEDCELAIDATLARFGRLDGLVNSAGHRSGGLLTTLSDADWIADFQLKLLSTVRMSRLAAPSLQQYGGAILNVLSIWSRFQGAGGLPSSALRAAGLALTKSVASELGPEGIRVNAVLIGVIESGQWTAAAKEAGNTVAEYVGGLAQQFDVPLGRAGHADELGDVAAFLLSPRASYVTGAALNVDGGLSPVP